MTLLPDQLKYLSSESTPTQPILLIGNSDWLEVSKEIQKRLEVNQIDVITILDPPGIEDLREQLQRIYYQPKNSKYSLLFLFHVDFWSDITLNKLLKLIEEPPQFLKIFLFAQKSSGVLPTILSRVQTIRLKNVIKNAEIISLKKIKQLTLAEALDEVKALVEKHKASAIMNHWMSELSKDEFDSKAADEIAKRLTLAGNQPVNQKMLLESIVFNIKLK